MRSSSNDLLYFVLPFDLKSLEHEKSAKLDMTYITSRDYVQVNMSLYARTVQTIDSVKFLSTTAFLADSVHSFFVEMEKSKWHHRFGFRLDFAVVQKLYATETPYTLCVYAGSQTFRYAFPASKWKREQKTMLSLFQMMEYNRKK